MGSVFKKSVLVTMGLTGLIVGCNGQKILPGTTVEQALSLTSSFTRAQTTSLKEKLMQLFLPHAVAVSPVLKDSAGNDILLEAAWISLQNIKLKVAEASDDTDESDDSEDFEIAGPHFIDLMSSEPFSIDLSQLPVQAYDGIFLKLHKESPLPETAPEALAENSIYLSGTINGYLFSYTADDSTEIQLVGSQSLVPDAESSLLVVFGFAEMISKIDLSIIAADTEINSSNKVEAVNACPLIDPSAHDLFTCFRKGLEEQAKFGKDDGDHDLDEADEIVNE